MKLSKRERRKLVRELRDAVFDAIHKASAKAKKQAAKDAAKLKPVKPPIDAELAVVCELADWSELAALLHERGYDAPSAARLFLDASRTPQ
jgi:hypothetical protein